ncbi:PRC-barrel domain-containing protein [Guptibacillus algicola]|uniref:PRC-barrel domain-containing protein n=1 Tax=Guptibacillus algicola TaxID=225844 RepID=UPI001CD7191C|nr:PRC-barrel domain-containing protein [Alkalihalobacillus algicola]MCA0986228.1 PRC-barrel domain-containing protein [Alkalihalobacillus algicola]
MKKSNQIVGLPIISIESGSEIGHVKSLVVNASDKSIDFLTVDHPDWDVSVKAVPFRKVIGVGEYAVMIEEEKSIFDLSEIPIANELVKKKISIIGTKIINRKGQFHGEVSEYYLDDNTGRVIGLEFKTNDTEQFLSTEHVITLGKDLLIVAEDAIDHIVNQPEELFEPLKPYTSETYSTHGKVEVVREAPKEEPSAEEDNGFKEKQIAILEGKKLLKDIYTPSGELLFEEGSVLTRDEIEKAQETGVGVVVEMSMHVSG